MDRTRGWTDTRVCFFLLLPFITDPTSSEVGGSRVETIETQPRVRISPPEPEGSDLSLDPYNDGGSMSPVLGSHTSPPSPSLGTKLRSETHV